MNKQFNLAIPVFHAGIAFRFLDEKRFAANYAEELIPIARTELEVGCYPLIVFNTSQPIPIGVMAHEIIHALLYEFVESRGFSGFASSKGETFPYLMEFCLTECLKYCKKHKITVGEIDAKT